MEAMLIPVRILSFIIGIGSLVCFILVIIKMFQNDDQNWAIASLVLILCCIGGLVAFIRGWMKAGEWNITNLMMIWTGLIVINLILSIATFAIAMSVAQNQGFGPGGRQNVPQFKF